MTSLADAFVVIKPDTRGFAGSLRSQVSAGAAGVGRSTGQGFGRSFIGSARSIIGAGGGLIGLMGVGALVKSSVELEASFSKTLAQIRVATGAPRSALKGLHDEALKMGADTVFSANEAANAMLELAKAGVSTRDIMKGGIQGTLTLAAAGGLEMASAATIASNAINTFNLRGKDMKSVAAALAGGANASSASVETLGQALSQVGPGAGNAGLSLQETVGTLAAFANAGIAGSDAGTSLKTMLQRLVPQTDKQAAAMDKLGLSFVDSKGNIDDITTVAQKLQDRLGGLTQEQRTQALATIFGSDATRAATVLMKEGSDGLRDYIKATQDQGAAQRMARANMSGTAGALERLSGAFETAKLQLGEALAPTVRRFADYLSGTALPAITTFIGQMQSGKGAGGEFADALGTVRDAIGDAWVIAKKLVGVFNSLPDGLKKAVVIGAGGAAVLSKIPGGRAILGGAAKGLLPGGIQKVFVTNPGFAAGGAGGAAAGAEGAAVGAAAGRGAIVRSVALLAAKAAAAGTALAGLQEAANNLGGGKHRGGIFSDFTEPKTGAGKIFGPGHTLHHDLQDTFRAVTGPGGGAGLKIEQFISGATGVNSTLTTSVKNVDALDKAISRLEFRNPAMGAKIYAQALKESGLSSDQLAKVLPKTSRAMALMRNESEGSAKAGRRLVAEVFDTATAMKASGLSARQYGRFLHGLPKQVRTAISTPGALDSRKDVMDLKRQFDLTPKQVRTLMQIAGVNEAINEAQRLKSVYAGIPRYITTQAITQHIDKFTRITGAHAGGGQVLGGGRYLVGELGPEIFQAPAGGGRIRTAASTMSNVSSGDSGSRSGPAVIHVYDVDGLLLGSMRGQIDDDRAYRGTLSRQGVR